MSDEPKVNGKDKSFISRGFAYYSSFIRSRSWPCFVLPPRDRVLQMVYRAVYTVIRLTNPTFLQIHTIPHHGGKRCTAHRWVLCISKPSSEITDASGREKRPPKQSSEGPAAPE